VDDARVSIAIPAELGRLADVRRFVRAAAENAGSDAERRGDLVQAVDELVTNVIEHGYAGEAGAIEVELERSGDNIVVRIRDAAPAFDPTALPSPRLDLPLHERPLGGMGIHLARTLTDGMRHRILPGGGNEVTLEKVVEGSGGTDGHHDRAAE
jgi:anti-sigma regulatory factor (Ser/Thr protein kinase)